MEGYWPGYPDSSRGEPAPLPMPCPETALGSCSLQAPFTCLTRRRPALFAFFTAQDAKPGTAQEEALTRTVQTAARSTNISWPELQRQSTDCPKSATPDRCNAPASISDGDLFTLQNVYPGSDQNFVSYRESDLALRACYNKREAMPIRFVATDEPMVFKMQNRCTPSSPPSHSIGN